jgi:hypothetical protein
LSKGRSRDSFREIPGIYSAAPDSVATLEYVQAGAGHLNEVELPHGIL